MEMEEECFQIANSLIIFYHLPVPLVSNANDVNSKLFILLFEKICGAPIPDLIPNPVTAEHEAHNVQCVIDTLSLDILGLSLSHITGEDIVAGNITALYNLLEVFEGYLLYLTDFNKDSALTQEYQSIKKEVSSKNDREVQICPSCNSQLPIGKDMRSDGIRDRAYTKLNSVCSICNYGGVYRSQFSENKKFAACETDDFNYPTNKMARKLDDRPSEDLLREKTKTISTSSSVKENGKPKSEFTNSAFCVSEENQSKKKHSKVENNHLRNGGDIFSLALKDQATQTSIQKSVDRATSDRFSNSTVSSKSLVSSDVLFTEKKNLSLKGIKHSRSHSDLFQIGRQMHSTQERVLSKQKSKSLQDIFGVAVSKESSDDLSSFMEHVRVPRQFDLKHSTPEKIKDNRRHLRQAENGCHEDIANLYERNFENKIKIFLEKQLYHKRRTSQIKKAYLQALKRPSYKPISPVCRKSFLLPYSLRRRSPSHSTPRRLHIRIDSSSSSRHSFRNKYTQKSERREAAFLKELRNEFPAAHISPRTVNYMTKRYERHLRNMQKNVKEALQRKPQTQIQTEEAVKRQQILSEISNKEMQHSRNFQQVNESKEVYRKLKAAQQDAKLLSAHSKHRSDNFFTLMKSRLLKRHANEEQILKSLFEEGLNLQKEQIRYLRQQLREEDKREGRYHKIYLDALENFYQTQFAMLAESLAVEKHDLQERAKAQKLVLNMMKCEFRCRTDRKLQEFCDRLERENEEIIFKEMSQADRYRERLRDKFSVHTALKT